MGAQPTPSSEDESRLVQDVEKAREMAEAANNTRSSMAESRKEHGGTGDNVWGDSERLARFEEDLAAEKYEFQKRVENMGHRDLTKEVIRLRQMLKIAEEGKKFWDDRGYYGV